MQRTVLYNLSAFLVGLIFGCGLLLAGMTNPSKVLGFLDVAGLWDPSLALVMLGAIGVALGAFAYVKNRQHSWLGEPLACPPSQKIDRSLIIGALLFGAGWGLAGFCPGPAIVALALGQSKALLFVLAMLAGMLVHKYTQRA